MLYAHITGNQHIGSISMTDLEELKEYRRQVKIQVDARRITRDIMLIDYKSREEVFFENELKLCDAMIISIENE